MRCLYRWTLHRYTVTAWDVPLTGHWRRHVWTGTWSETARRWVRT